MMKRTFSHILLLALAIGATISCVKERVSDLTRTPGVKLLFSLGGVDTRSGVSGVKDGTANENVINSLDYFLYTNGSTGNALVSGHVASEDIVRANSRDGNTVNAPAYSVNMGENTLRALFSGGVANATCTVYVIANYPGTINHSGTTSLSYLQSLIVSSSFRDVTPGAFIMDGLGTAILYDRSRTDAAEGVIPLQRIASKITLEVHCAEYVDVTNNITSGDETITQTIRWEPMLSLMKANLCNGKESGALGGSENEAAPTFKYTKTDMTAGEGGAYNSIPFYSYPRTWHNGDEDAPYVKLELPWKTGATQKQYYYKVPLPGQALVKNNWYHIVLNVAIIGGEDFEAGLEITGTYYVVPWETHVIIQAEAEIVNARYLSVPITQHVMYNENTLTIPFMSSHDCKIRDVLFTQPNNQTNPPETNTFVNILGTGIAGTRFYLQTAAGDSLLVKDRTIVFKHVLRNESESDYDTAPYSLQFTLCHEDALTDYAQTITVTQHPAMEIEVCPNSDPGRNSPNNSGHTTEDGYVFINGTRSHESNKRTNTNFNMYVITASVLPSTGPISGYLLGDPRQRTVDNSLGSADNTWSATAVYVGGGQSTRKLSYYRPSGADPTYNDIIAPSFRIASSFGTSSYMDRNTALQRCASYQEDGYPAGRWRLPTKAEIEFMVRLSQRGKIPALFSSESDLKYGGYWCSYGAVFPLNDGSLEYKNLSEAMAMTVYNENNNVLGTGVHYTRCVYDEWFWKNSSTPTVDRETYTWGDQNL